MKTLKFNYLAVNCGYTQRLIEKIPDIVLSLMEIYHDDECDCVGDGEMCKKLDCKCERCKEVRNLCLFILDTDYSFKRGSEKCIKKEIYHVITSSPKGVKEADRIKEKLKKSSGIIVFKCNTLDRSFEIVKILQECNHCACFRGEPYEISYLENEILELKYDTESG